MNTNILGIVIAIIVIAVAVIAYKARIKPAVKNSTGVPIAPPTPVDDGKPIKPPVA